MLFAVAIIVAGAGALTWALVRPDSRTVEILLPTPGPIIVHVTGEVTSPGVYTLEPGSRVSDAIEAAGGLAGSSDVNMAAPLRDGQQLIVTADQPAMPSNPDQSAEPTEPAVLLDLNTASAAQLEELPNIGPARASSIVSFRERNGPILFVDDLTAIDGIGPSTVEGLRPLVVQP